MVWFKVDDGFASSRKVLSIPRTQRAAAIGVWTLAGSWAAKELTDGVVPQYALDELGVTPRLSRALVEARLWLDHPEGGIVFKNWADFQPTRAEVEAERAKTAERQARWRERHKGETGESRVSNAVTNGDVTRESRRESRRPVPTRPDPTLNNQDRYNNPPEVDARAEDDVDPVLAAVVEACRGMGVEIHPLCAADVVGFIDSRRRRNAPPVKVPTRYYPDAVRDSWPEVSKFIYTEGLVA